MGLRQRAGGQCPNLTTASARAVFASFSAFFIVVVVLQRGGEVGRKPGDYLRRTVAHQGAVTSVDDGQARTGRRACVRGSLERWKSL